MTDGTPPADDADVEDGIWEALEEVSDPDLPTSVVELGLIYGVEVTDGRAVIEMTFTSMGCPATGMLKGDVRTAAARVDGVEEVEVEVVWDPPWTKERITDSGREKLRTVGISI